jgi:hypothetical protein
MVFVSNCSHSDYAGLGGAAHRSSRRSLVPKSVSPNMRCDEVLADIAVVSARAGDMLDERQGEYLQALQTASGQRWNPIRSSHRDRVYVEEHNFQPCGPRPISAVKTCGLRSLA